MKSIHIVEDCLPLAWEKAVLECWDNGDSFNTQYDKPGDPPSKDVLAVIHVKKPFVEPRIHRAFPGGLNDLWKYAMEVLHGVHDYWMHDISNPNRWEYTYHQRLFQYDCEAGPVNQIDRCVEQLQETGFTRRAQAITWQPWKDQTVFDPPCLQRMWFRVQDHKLNMTVDMRSNDAYKAAFMNAFAFTELQKQIARRVGVEPGEYVHIADSFHIYGSYFADMAGFEKLIKDRRFEDRTFTTAMAIPFFIEACDELLLEANMPQACRDEVTKSKAFLSCRAE